MNKAASAVETAHQKLTVAAERALTLESRKDRLKSELSQLDSERQVLARTILDTRNALRGYNSPDDQRQVAAAAKYTEELAALLTRETALHATIERHRRELEEIDDALAAFDKGATAEAIAHHQRLILGLSKKIEQLQELIDAQQRTVDEAGEGLLDLTPLYRTRDDVLADIAIGDADTSALAPINKEIEAREAERKDQGAKKDEAAREASRVIAGLRRKVEGHQQELDALQRLFPKMMDQFLMVEGMAALRTYHEHALATVQAMVRLVALERLVVENGERLGPVFFTGNQTQTFLPDSIISPASATGRIGIFVDGISPNSEQVLQALRAERERFENLGVIAP